MSQRARLTKREWRRRYRIGMWLAFVLCAAAFVVGISMSRAGDGSRDPGAAVFSTARGSGDQLPGTGGAQDRSNADYLKLGLDQDRSHRLAAPAESSSRWIAPTDDGRICLVDLPRDVDGPAVACSADVTEPNVNYTEREDGKLDVYGYVPDATSDVNLTFADGTRQLLSARQNAFGTVSAAAPISATFDGSSGAQTIRLAP